MRLSGKVAIVTGGGSGIGRAIVTLFAEEGAHVVVADIDRSAGEQAASEVRASGGAATAAAVDVSSFDDVSKMVEAVHSSLGAVDVLVNSAAYSKFGPIEELEVAQWHRVLDVTLNGTFYCCLAVAKVMIRQRRGKIVNIGSLAGIVGIPDQPPYVAAKHGVVGLTKALAADLGVHHINVNCVCPATTLTPMALQTRSAEFLEKEPLNHPLGRLATPEDQAHAVLFLASSEADYLTGVILPVDGGRSATLRTRQTVPPRT